MLVSLETLFSVGDSEDLITKYQKAQNFKNRRKGPCNYNDFPDFPPPAPSVRQPLT